METLGTVVFKELHDNMWLIEFATESDKRRVLEGKPSLFDRSILVLKEVDDNVPPLHMVFTHEVLWVQVLDMPLSCMNNEVGLRLGVWKRWM